MAIMLLLVGALFFTGNPGTASLSPADLASKHVVPPLGWNDPDCSRTRSTILDAVRKSAKKLAMNAAALTADEIAVYQTILRQWNTGYQQRLNLSDKTAPLDAASLDDIANCRCLQSVEIESLVSALHSFHSFSPGLFPEGNVQLVNSEKQLAAVQNSDPSHWIGMGRPVHKAVNDAIATGLFTMSEIAFEKGHRRALVSYRFVCGLLCGSGGTLLLEKVDGVWKKIDLDCGGWIS